jgi:hypothetical protein
MNNPHEYTFTPYLHHMVHTGKSAFDEVNEKVSQAGEILGIKPGVISALRSCEREVTISIPLRPASMAANSRKMLVATTVRSSVLPDAAR